MKKILLAVIVFIAAAGLAGEALMEKQVKNEKNLAGISVKIVMPTLSTEYEAYLAESLEHYLRDYGFGRIDCVSYELDTMKAVEIVENCIVEEVDLICMYPLDDATAAVQKKAMEAGIGVITVGMDNGQYDCLVKMEHVKAGKIIAETCYSWMKRTLPKGSQVATIGTNLNRNTKELTDAMNERLKELTEGEFEIVEMVLTDGTGQDGMGYVESLLQRYPRLSAVAAYNDTYAIAAAEMFRIMDKAGEKVGVFGCGGTLQAMTKIENSDVMRGTVLMGDTARKIADAAYAWANQALDDQEIRYTYNLPITIDNVSEHS